MEKIVVTLGERFAREAQRLLERRISKIDWLELIDPLIERDGARAERTVRFERRDGVPRAHPGPVASVLPPLRMHEPGDEGVPLPPQVRERLRDVAGPAVDVARVHSDERADAIACNERAEAVTVGEHVYFRSGAYAPAERDGLALIAHEVTHVGETLRPGASWRRATQAGINEEEHRARRNERTLLGAQPSIPRISPTVAALSPHSSPALHRNASTPSPSVQLHAMKAEMDRERADAPAPPPAAAPNLEAMRRDLVRDLMQRIRVEYERGA